MKPTRCVLLGMIGGVVVGALLVIALATLRGALVSSTAAPAAHPTATPAGSYMTILSASGPGAVSGATAPVTTRAFTVSVSWRIVAREVCANTTQAAASAQSIGVGVLDAGNPQTDALVGMQVGYVALLGSCVDGQMVTAILSEHGAGRYQLRVQAWEPWTVSVQSLNVATAQGR